HKLREVKAIADRITVIRRGAVVGTARPDASEDELASMMVGRTVKLRVDKSAAAPGEPVLTVRDLSVFDDRGHEAVAGTSLEVRAGEVLAVAGAGRAGGQGAGRRVRRAPGVAAGHRGYPLRRQPAEGHHRPGADPQGEAARGGPAHSRGRRRVHTVHPRPGDPGARRGRGGT